MRRVPSPKARLGAFAGLLVLLGVAVAVLSPVSRAGLREALDPFGAAAPVVFVLVSAVLGNLFVPGPVLAGASGLLFGTATGVVVSIAAAVLGSVLATWIAHAAGRPGVEELEQPRVRLVEALLQRHGVWAVVVQRLLPAVPDAPCSYLFGLAGLRAWQVAVGTLVGAAPRAFSYTAIGDGLGEGSTTIGLVGLGVLVVTGALGAVVGLVALRRTRREP